MGGYAPTPYGGTLKIAFPLVSWRCYALQPCGALFASCLTTFVRVFTEPRIFISLHRRAVMGKY